jgi:hypothetical protein
LAIETITICIFSGVPEEQYGHSPAQQQLPPMTLATMTDDSISANKGRRSRRRLSIALKGLK